MKKLIILTLLVLNYSLSASVNCLSNSKHLAEDFDDKEWRPVACDCPCTTIKGNKCIECCHLQNASTYVVVVPSKVAQDTQKHPSYDVKSTLRQLAFEYLQSKK